MTIFRRLIKRLPIRRHFDGIKRMSNAHWNMDTERENTQKYFLTFRFWVFVTLHCDFPRRYCEHCFYVSLLYYRIFKCASHFYCILSMPKIIEQPLNLADIYNKRKLCWRNFIHSIRSVLSLNQNDRQKIYRQFDIMHPSITCNRNSYSIRFTCKDWRFLFSSYSWTMDRKLCIVIQLPRYAVVCLLSTICSSMSSRLIYLPQFFSFSLI